MIFVCTGSRNYQFNRLIQEIDRLAKLGKIQDKVFAQIGETDYIPKHIEYKRYIDATEYAEYQEMCNILITHGGTGSIVGALKKGKNVIAVPRLAKYGEHIDDHQIQIVDEYVEKKCIIAVKEIEQLENAIVFFEKGNRLNSYSSDSPIIKVLDEYIKKVIGEQA